MHITKGKTLAQSISDRTDYGLNPEKTRNGELTSAYACDPRSFAAEVLVAKRQYKFLTGKEEKVMCLFTRYANLLSREK